MFKSGGNPLRFRRIVGFRNPVFENNSFDQIGNALGRADPAPALLVCSANIRSAPPGRLDAAAIHCA
jgi:hypothetical protein